MVSFDDLLGALYEIQGLADPEHDRSMIVPSRRVTAFQERVALIYAIACDMMERSGYQPPEPQGLTVGDRLLNACVGEKII